MVGALLAAVLLGGPHAVSASRDSLATVPLPVRIYDTTGVPVEDITAASTRAAAILRAAGIQPRWFHCRRAERPNQSSSGPCFAGVRPDDVVVRILRSPQSETVSHTLPLGEAVVDPENHQGWLTTVFADRVVSLSDRAGADPSDVLGRVIAHEIGHLLLGARHHAKHGLMRAVWTDRELRRPFGLHWHFSTSEARLIHTRAVERVRAD